MSTTLTGPKATNDAKDQAQRQIAEANERLERMDRARGNATVAESSLSFYKQRVRFAEQYLADLWTSDSPEAKQAIFGLMLEISHNPAKLRNQVEIIRQNDILVGLREEFLEWVKPELDRREAKLAEFRRIAETGEAAR